MSEDLSKRGAVPQKQIMVLKHKLLGEVHWPVLCRRPDHTILTVPFCLTLCDKVAASRIIWGYKSILDVYPY